MVVSERDRVAVEHPEDSDEADRAEAHHHHADDALRLDHAAVEERKSWRHEQHERC